MVEADTRVWLYLVAFQPPGDSAVRDTVAAALTGLGGVCLLGDVWLLRGNHTAGTLLVLLRMLLPEGTRVVVSELAEDRAGQNVDPAWMEW
jgi:hypothetical protein